MIIDPNTHIFMTSSQEVDEMIKPLKAFFGLTSFVYQYNFNDGSEIRLSNQPAWMHYFYEQGLYEKSLFETHPSEFKKTRIVWSGLTVHQPILQKAREFNIDHGITFVEPQKDGCEFFFLGTSVDQPQVMSKYLNHIDLLERFLDYFRDKAKPLIERAMKEKIVIPNKFERAPKGVLCKDLDRRAFLNLLNPQHFSRREMQCISLLTCGYTHKMIAKELGISPRTVETYLEHIKNKTDMHTKGELVKYFLKLPID